MFCCDIFLNGPCEDFSFRFGCHLTLQLPGFSTFVRQFDDPEIVILTSFLKSTLAESALIKTIKVSSCFCSTGFHLLICRNVILVTVALEPVANTEIERREELIDNCTYEQVYPLSVSSH